MNRVFWELVRVAVIAGIVFGFVQWRSVDVLQEHSHQDCHNAALLRKNQAIVLRTLIRFDLTLNDVSAPNSKPFPDRVFFDLEEALASLPQIECS